MRGVLLAVTVLLAVLVAFASPLGELLVELASSGPAPLVLTNEPRCSPGLPEDPWWRWVGGQLGVWIETARTVTADPIRASGLRARSLGRTVDPARSTLGAVFELRQAPQTDAPRLAPPPAERHVEVMDVRFCPGAPPVWEVSWSETAGPGSRSLPRPTRWRAVLRVEEIRIPAEHPPEAHFEHPEGFFITDFDWGRVPTDPGAGGPAPSQSEEQSEEQKP